MIYIYLGGILGSFMVQWFWIGREEKETKLSLMLLATLTVALLWPFALLGTVCGIAGVAWQDRVERKIKSDGGL